jgi:F0F1-type ATP synthase membrane subunit b/b'
MPEFNATLVFVMVSFIIFMVLMKAIYFDPMLKIKYERERKLTDDKNSAQQFAEDYERIHADYQTGLQKARKEAHLLIQEIRQSAKTTAQQTLSEARSAAQVETDRQMAELHNWREATYGQLESERNALTRAIIAKVTAGGRIKTASGS